jgi:hypothetical protein
MVMVLLQKVLTDFKSFNVDVIALGDLQINDNIGLTYLTVNFSSEYDQRGGSYKISHLTTIRLHMIMP